MKTGLRLWLGLGLGYLLELELGLGFVMTVQIKTGNRHLRASLVTLRYPTIEARDARYRHIVDGRTVVCQNDDHRLLRTMSTYGVLHTLHSLHVHTPVTADKHFR